MKTQYYVASTLDGFIADSEHSLDWLLQFGDGSGEEFSAFIGAVGAIAMGSSTYEWILRHHILPGTDRPQAWPYAVPTWVLSSRNLPNVPGADISFACGDIRSLHAKMASTSSGRNIWIVGGGDLAGQFYDCGLLDEIIVGVTSVTLGAGAALLPRRIVTPPLRLRSAQAYGAEFALLTYDVPKVPPHNNQLQQTAFGRS